MQAWKGGVLENGAKAVTGLYQERNVVRMWAVVLWGERWGHSSDSKIKTLDYHNDNNKYFGWPDVNVILLVLVSTEEPPEKMADSDSDSDSAGKFIFILFIYICHMR